MRRSWLVLLLGGLAIHPLQGAANVDAAFKVFWDAPNLVLLCGRRGNPETPFDCHRAAQNLLLAAHARGLGSCWVGAPMPWLASPGIAAELGLPADFDAVVAISLGYPAEAPLGSPRPKPKIHWCDGT